MRVLLIGGPFNWRTLDVKDHQYEIHIPIPTETPLSASIDPYEPVSADFKVASYKKDQQLYHPRYGLMGWLYIHDETR